VSGDPTILYNPGQVRELAETNKTTVPYPTHVKMEVADHAPTKEYLRCDFGSVEFIEPNHTNTPKHTNVTRLRELIQHQQDGMELYLGHICPRNELASGVFIATNQFDNDLLHNIQCITNRRDEIFCNVTRVAY
jgi:hypothetical protein